MLKQFNRQLFIGVMSIAMATLTGTAYAQSDSPRPYSQSDQPCTQDRQQKRFKKPRFADLDLDGDSFVTLSEFKEKPIPHGDHDTVFGHIDADGNGEITQSEFDSHRPPPPPRRQAQSGRSRG